MGKRSACNSYKLVTNFTNRRFYGKEPTFNYNFHTSKGFIPMAYVSVTHWTLTEWADDFATVGQDKFIPMIMSVGASAVQMVRTGDLALTVVTQYDSEETAIAAQQKIADIRATAASDFPMTMVSGHTGNVVASS